MIDIGLNFKFYPVWWLKFQQIKQTSLERETEFDINIENVCYDIKERIFSGMLMVLSIYLQNFFNRLSHNIVMHYEDFAFFSGQRIIAI